MKSTIKGLLIDLDGVLYEGKQPIPGAVEAIRFLQEKSIPFRLITNTTMKSRQSLQTQLKVMGFNVSVEDIFSAPYAASLYLKKHKAQNVYLFVKGTTSMDFKDFKLTEMNPEYIVVGDLAEDFNYERLNKAFRIIMNGAKIIALQKNRFWKTEQGLTLDVGPFVTLLEYATNRKSHLVGKPSVDFFKMAAMDMELPMHEVLMVGDDVEVDIAGAQQSGGKGLLVHTGKFNRDFVESLSVVPDFELDSIAQIPDFLKEEQFKNGA